MIPPLINSKAHYSIKTGKLQIYIKPATPRTGGIAGFVFIDNFRYCLNLRTRPGTLSSSVYYPHTKGRFHPPQAVLLSSRAQVPAPFRIWAKAVLRGRFHMPAKAALQVLPYFPAAREAL